MSAVPTSGGSAVGLEAFNRAACMEVTCLHLAPARTLIVMIFLIARMVWSTNILSGCIFESPRLISSRAQAVWDEPIE